jgi:hypothetical protein
MCLNGFLPLLFWFYSGMWIRDERRKTARNNQDTNNGLESYHGHVKDVLFCRRRNAFQMRLDEAVHTLVGDFCISIWYKDQKKLVGLTVNRQKDKHVCYVLIKARSMTRLTVSWPYGYYGPASQVKPDKKYFVHWKLDKYACECFWSLQGNYCKHQV